MNSNAYSFPKFSEWLAAYFKENEPMFYKTLQSRYEAARPCIWCGFVVGQHVGGDKNCPQLTLEKTFDARD